MRRTLLKTGVKALLAACLLTAPHATAAATRGGKMIYARYADSLFLDPVLNDANTDIWVLTNLYDTLLAPTKDGLGVQPGLATKWESSADSKALTTRRQIRGRLPAHRG